jgi:hypothetical protein
MGGSCWVLVWIGGFWVVLGALGVEIDVVGGFKAPRLGGVGFTFWVLDDDQFETEKT